jgi:MoxR-like ATPase
MVENGPSSDVAAWARRVLTEINKVFIGQDKLVRGVLAALLAEGHVLIESVPGLGKTLLVRALGHVLGCGFSRIQFTPDLMPSDVTGSPIFDERIHDFRFRPGPVFTQLLLADEINRAPAKTHSALLEIMQENRVTIDGVNHPIDPPFLVLATQNPIESEGTYNLPEAQLDRFLFKLVVDYPAEREEVDILRLHTRGTPPDRELARQLTSVTNPADVIAMQRRCAEVLVDDHVLGYIAALVRATRRWPTFSLGVSPRAGVSMLRGARAVAALEGRDYTVPDDVQEVVLPALRHRVMLTPEAEVEGQSPDDLLSELVRSVEVPLR